ncbi:derlin-1 [Cryptomeria japonica]|uniref:derlin-1 n=1 Tax=Cryptomeria japonica TaxID=3369 RepID=UPI0027D9E699|nr:derlin-1 [Cryptomeria japonica]
MSSPGDWFNSLPPVSKAYGTLCLMTTAGCHMGLVNPKFLYLDYDLVVKHLQIWRLLTNFFFLGRFSINFAIRLLIIARYGVHLERGPFERRTGDFLWMMIFGALSLLGFSLFPALNSDYMGMSLVFMLPYIWAREFPNAQVNISGLVTLKGFYLPWAMLAMNVIFGSPLIPDLLGIVVGHLYYFLTELHPRAGGNNILKTPIWIHKLVALWNVGPQASSPVQSEPTTGTVFRGRSYRLGR